MKAFSITAPEDIAKEYGGDKRKIQQAAAQGLIDPTSAVLAGMFIDRIRGAAQAEQANQPTVAEQVMAPQPQPQQQIPSAGLAASPQAAQMQQPMAPRMGQPAMGRMPQPAPAQMPPAQQPPMQQPMGMAMGGGLDSIDFVEQSYAPGGIVGFSAAGGVSADREALLSRRNQLEADLRTARIQGDRDSLTQQINAIDRQLAGSTSQALSGIEQGKAMERQAQAEFAAAANQQMPDLIAGGTSYPQVPTAPGQLEFELPSASPYGPESSRIDPNRFDTGTPTEEEAMRISAGEGSSGIFPENAGQPFSDFVDKLGRFVGGRKVVAPEDSVGLMELISGRNAEQEAALARGRGEVVEQPGERAASMMGGRGQIVEQPGERAASMMGGRGTVVEQPGERAASLVSEPAGRIITDPAEIAALEANTQGPGTIADQIAEQQATTATTEPAPAPEGDKESKPADTDMPISEQFNVFQKELSGLMPKSEYGEYRKKFETMIDDFDKTKKEAKKDGFNMALLQAGLGMLAQGGGQTALQALGKAALPATKQYAKEMKDLKKEERELFKLGLSLEQMDAKERAEANRTMVNLFGRKMAGEYQIKAANIAASKKGVDAQLLEELGPEGYLAAKERIAKAGATTTGGFSAMRAYQDKVATQQKFIAEALKDLEDNELLEFRAKKAGKTPDQYKKDRLAEIRKEYPMPNPADFGLSGGQTTGDPLGIRTP